MHITLGLTRLNLLEVHLIVVLAVFCGDHRRPHLDGPEGVGLIRFVPYVLRQSVKVDEGRLRRPTVSALKRRSTPRQLGEQRAAFRPGKRVAEFYGRCNLQLLRA